MATCPRCRGHLTETHRCPRRPGMMAVEITVSAIAGGLIALFLVALADERAQFPRLDIVVVTIGMFVGIGIDRLLRGW